MTIIIDELSHAVSCHQFQECNSNLVQFNKEPYFEPIQYIQCRSKNNTFRTRLITLLFSDVYNYTDHNLFNH